MSDEVKSEKKVFTLRLSASAAEDVEKIARELGITTTEVFRRALGTEMFILETKERGEKLLVENKKQEVREVVFR